ncbi:SNF2-related protein [Streptomyces sp. NPDC000927]|uniref:SNF2-related protein n=1 Tax=Streptomyces sp. NPDC000927 TaxID=3154371 RepID=UPI00331FF563
MEDSVHRYIRTACFWSWFHTGKTLMSVEHVRHLKLGRIPRVLVVAPVNTLGQWRDTFAEQYPSLQSNGLLRIVGTHKSDPESWKLITAKKPGVTLIGWEAMRGRVDGETKAAHSRAATKEPKLTVAAVRQGMRDGTVPPWHRAGVFDLVIADEVHRISNRHAGQSRVLKLIQANRKLAVSATFSGNKEEGAWSVLNWLWKDQYPAFWGWAEKFLKINEEKVSRSKTITTIGGELNPGAIWNDIPCAVRHRTEELGLELPEVIERVVTVPMGMIQRQQYDDFEQQAFAWLDDHPVGTPLPITQRIRLRQVALGQLKMNELTFRRRFWVPPEEVDQFLVMNDDMDPQIHKQRKKVMREVQLNDGAEFQVLESTSTFKASDSPWKLPTVELDSRDANPALILSDSSCRWQSLFDPAWKIGLETQTLVRVSRNMDIEEIDFNENGDQSKLATVKEILRDLPSDEPVLIFTHSAKWARMAAAHIDAAGIYGEARAWTGDLTSKQREGLKSIFGVMEPSRIRSKFGHKGIRVLVCQVESLAEGVDGLQHRCRCEVWASPSENNLSNEQAKGRLHRPGQTSPVQRWVLRSEGSIDTDVAESLEARWARMRSLYRDDVVAA